MYGAYVVNSLHQNINQSNKLTYFPLTRKLDARTFAKEVLWPIQYDPHYLLESKTEIYLNNIHTI